MIGEWVALPVLHSAGADGPLDPLAEQVMYPPRSDCSQHCDAVLRLPGESTGADQDVAIARQRGLPVYHRLQEIPGHQPERADDHSPQHGDVRTWLRGRTRQMADGNEAALRHADST